VETKANIQQKEGPYRQVFSRIGRVLKEEKIGGKYQNYTYWR